MTPARPLRLAVHATLTAFARDSSGANAVEFAMIGTPFVLLLLFILQIGLLYATKSALDTGVLRATEGIEAQFATGLAPSLPTASVLKTEVATYAGGLISSGSSLQVEVQPISNLSSGSVAIQDGLTSYGTAKTILVMRAKFPAIAILPGFGSATSVVSSALVRRQTQ